MLICFQLLVVLIVFLTFYLKYGVNFDILIIKTNVMKKIFILGFALFLFSCSQEDNASFDAPLKKDVSTVDSLIGFKSPYDDQSSSFTHNDKLYYIFKNETDLNFKITPYFSFCFEDWDEDQSTYRYVFDLIDPIDGFDCIHLAANGKKYGNYLAANYSQPFLLGKETLSLQPNQDFVPRQSSSSVIDGFDFNQGNPDGIAATFGEEILITSFGKIFYVQAEILDNGVSIENTYLKADFPTVSSSSIYSNTGEWRTLYPDSFFGEMMVFNIYTKEICIPNTELSVYTSRKQFAYAGKNYEMGMRSDEEVIEVYLKEI